MARDNRVIKSGIRHAKNVYLPGQEDELEQILTPAMHDHLQDKGAIEGDWNVSDGEESEAPASEAKSPILDEATVQALEDAGFETPAAAAAASDDQLLGVKGVTKSKLKALRASLARAVEDSA